MGWREIISVARCEGKFVIFGNCGLQRMGHLPAILPPQGSCEISYSAVNDEGRKTICNCSDRKLSRHFQEILRRGGYSVEVVDHDHGIDEDGGNYFCHSFRNRR